MEEMKKETITPKWELLKKMFKEGTNGVEEYGKNFSLDGEFNKLSSEFVDMLGDITMDQGFRVEIEGLTLDQWKERGWNVIERAGLLPEIAWRDDKEDKFASEKWGDESEFAYLDDEFFEKEIIKTLSKK
jgi:hypothetical protein|tara:strand:- start:1185 stop:1574 length:390 start_codon:yes stop_codon:yes gene_type:complete